MTKKPEKRMPSEEFVPLYLDAVEAGMVREDFAEAIGVSSNTVYQRIYQMHQKGACQKTFPQLQTRGRRTFREKIDAAVAEWEKSKGRKAAIQAVMKANEQQPKPKARAKQAAKDEPVPAPPAGPDGDVDTDAFLDQLLNG